MLVSLLIGFFWTRHFSKKREIVWGDAVFIGTLGMITISSILLSLGTFIALRGHNWGLIYGTLSLSSAPFYLDMDRFWDGWSITGNTYLTVAGYRILELGVIRFADFLDLWLQIGLLARYQPDIFFSIISLLSLLNFIGGILGLLAAIRLKRKTSFHLNYSTKHKQ